MYQVHDLHSLIYELEAGKIAYSLRILMSHWTAQFKSKTTAKGIATNRRHCASFTQ